MGCIQKGRAKGQTIVGEGSGCGWGHGGGMAEKKATYDAIVAHYYQGALLEVVCP